MDFDIGYKDVEYKASWKKNRGSPNTPAFDPVLPQNFVPSEPGPIAEIPKEGEEPSISEPEEAEVQEEKPKRKRRASTKEPKPKPEKKTRQTKPVPLVTGRMYDIPEELFQKLRQEMSDMKFRFNKLNLDILRTPEEAIHFLNNEEFINLDLETTGLNPWKSKIAVIGLYGPVSGKSVVLHNPRGEFPGFFIDWMASKTPSGKQRQYITHNGAQFDIPFLYTHGMDVWSVDWWDTMISEQVTIVTTRKGVSVSLKATLDRRLNIQIKKDMNHETWKNETLTDDQIEYVISDIQLLHHLKRQHIVICEEDLKQLNDDGTPRYKKTRVDALNFEMRLLPIVSKMTCNGIPIDLDELRRFLAGQAEVARDKEEFLQEYFGGINLQSVPQLKQALQTVAGKSTYIPNTKSETILDIAYEQPDTELGKVCEALTVYRHAKQRLKVYDEDWINDYVVWDVNKNYHFVHPRFKQLGANTGRFTSSEPNLQQVPKTKNVTLGEVGMRHIFGNLPGYKVVSVDFSQIEVRCAALVARDMALIDALKLGDIHRYVASQLFRVKLEDVTEYQRQAAKAATFTLTFGGEAWTLRNYAKMYGVRMDMDEARKIEISFFDTFQALNNMRDKAEVKAQKPSHTLTLVTGLRRNLHRRKWGDPADLLNDGEDLKATKILNTTIQSLAAAGLKNAMIELEQYPYKDGNLTDLLSVAIHDELVFIVPEEDAEMVAKQAQEAMINGMYKMLRSTLVPVEAEYQIGDTWEG